MRGLMPQQSRIVIGAVIDIAISAIVIAAGQVLPALSQGHSGCSASSARTCAPISAGNLFYGLVVHGLQGGLHGLPDPVVPGEQAGGMLPRAAPAPAHFRRHPERQVVGPLAVGPDRVAYGPHLLLAHWSLSELD
jgi:hypothetical protein